MAAKRQRRKWTAAQLREQIDKIKKLIENRKRENKSEHFMALTPEEIEKKLKQVNSPMIYFYGWSGTIPGGTFDLFINVYNPDSTEATGLIAHVWVGSGNIDPIISSFC